MHDIFGMFATSFKIQIPKYVYHISLK